MWTEKANDCFKIKAYECLTVPFQDDYNADVALVENEFDTPAVVGWRWNREYDRAVQDN